MHLLVPRSRSSAKVKVKYKGYISQKNGRFGGIHVSQTHLVFTSAPNNIPSKPLPAFGHVSILAHNTVNLGKLNLTTAKFEFWMVTGNSC